MCVINFFFIDLGFVVIQGLWQKYITFFFYKKNKQFISIWQPWLGFYFIFRCFLRYFFSLKYINFNLEKMLATLLKTPM